MSTAVLSAKQQFGDRDTLYTFTLPEAVDTVPGQFVEVRIREGETPFLRRPISIFHAKGDQLQLLIRTVGAGTREMLTWEPGYQADLLLPLGNGFRWENTPGDCLLIGGGIGIAPLNYLAEKLLDAGKRVHLLFLPKRDSGILKAVHRLAEMDIQFIENRKALPDALKTALTLNMGTGGVYTCGPNAMMELVAKTAAQYGVPCQVSMEARMGCGFGICVGCVVRIRDGDSFVYKKACMDGPVFQGEEVLFDE